MASSEVYRKRASDEINFLAFMESRDLFDIPGDLEVTGDIYFDGDMNFGDTVADTLTVNGLFNQGTNGTPLSYTEGTPLRTLYATNAGTSGVTNAEPLYVKSVLTGPGQVGGRSRFHTYSNVASGGWINALKAFMEFGPAGRTTGLGSGFVSEIQLSAGTVGSSYAALEAEIVLPAGASTGERTSFLYCNATGDGVATFDTNGYFLHVGDGITAATDKFVSETYQSLKCFFTDSSTTRYMVLSQMQDGLGLGNSVTPMDLSTSLTKRAIDVYTTSASVNGGTSVRPIYMKSVMTGPGGVGGRAEFHMYTNVALGGWSNALKGYAEYGASGRTTGLGSGVCAEIALEAGTTSGTYAALEAEIVLPSGAKTGTSTSFLYCNTAGDDRATFDTNGFLFEIGAGITAGSGKLFDSTINTAGAQIDHTLRIKLPTGETGYIGVMNNADGS